MYICELITKQGNKMANEIELQIAGMIYNQSLGGTYSLVMSEVDGMKRRFSVLIGEAEAQSIALHLNNTKAPRPLSHDLMNSIVNELNAKLIKIVIYKMTNDIFYSELYLVQNEKSIVIDARTSDAVALAVRSNAPIFINSEILDIVGTVIGVDAEEKAQTPAQKQIDLDNITKENIKTISEQDLEELLEDALEEERYEIAAMIRDEISLRKK